MFAALEQKRRRTDLPQVPGANPDMDTQVGCAPVDAKKDQGTVWGYVEMMGQEGFTVAPSAPLALPAGPTEEEVLYRANLALAKAEIMQARMKKKVQELSRRVNLQQVKLKKNIEAFADHLKAIGDFLRLPNNENEKRDEQLRSYMSAAYSLRKALLSIKDSSTPNDDAINKLIAAVAVYHAKIIGDDLYKEGIQVISDRYVFIEALLLHYQDQVNGVFAALREKPSELTAFREMLETTCSFPKTLFGDDDSLQEYLNIIAPPATEVTISVQMGGKR